MRLLVAYKLALKLLNEITLLEKDPAPDTVKLACTNRCIHSIVPLTLGFLPSLVYAKLLAAARLLPKHRLVCARIAIDKSMETGNYGVAAHLLKPLLSLQLPDHASLASKLSKCEDEKLADKTLPPPYVCPACHTIVSPAAPVCPSCSRVPYFCVLVRISYGQSFLLCH